MTIEKRHLIFWWHNYGKFIYTFEELEKFEKIIDTYGIDKVLDAAIASFICQDGSPTFILMSIRTEKVEELFNSLPDFSKMDKTKKEQYETVKNVFIKLLTDDCA